MKVPPPTSAHPQLFVAAACSIVVIWYASALPGIWERDLRLIHGELSADCDGIGDGIAAARLIADGTTADEFVLTDAPYLALMTGRMVPPPLMDPSNSRTRAGALTEEQLIAGIRDYDADFIALWTGKLSGGRNDMDHRRLQLLIVRETLVKHGVRAACESE